MENPWTRSLTTVSNLLIYGSAISVGSLTAFVILSAFMRYFVGTPFNFTEELVGLLFMVMVFLTLPRVTLKSEHINVTLLTQMLSFKRRTMTSILGECIVLIFVIWFGIETFKYAHFSSEISARSEQAEILLTPWLAVMPICLFIVATIILSKIITKTRLLITNRNKITRDLP